jgi:hypothetical protein
MEKYEIYLAKRYHEDATYKVRPCVYYGEDSLGMPIFMKITSNNSHPDLNVAIDDWKSAGMYKESNIQPLRLQTLRDNEIIKRIGKLSDRDAESLERYIMKALEKTKNLEYMKDFLMENTFRSSFFLHRTLDNHAKALSSETHHNSKSPMANASYVVQAMGALNCALSTDKSLPMNERAYSDIRETVDRMVMESPRLKGFDISDRTFICEAAAYVVGKHYDLDLSHRDFSFVPVFAAHHSGEQLQQIMGAVKGLSTELNRSLEPTINRMTDIDHDVRHRIGDPTKEQGPFENIEQYKRETGTDIGLPAGVQPLFPEDSESRVEAQVMQR